MRVAPATRVLAGVEPPRRPRMLTLADIPAAVALESDAYGDELTPTAFEAELTRNPVARYIAVDDAAGGLAGFAGLWLQLDEAHVVTVAVAPALRRNGLGRLLVHALLDLAMRYRMSVATLEVRATNVAARALYRAYGFYEVGERKGYYRDGGDALIMTTEELASPAYQRRYATLGEALRTRLAIDALTVDPATVPDL